MKPELRWSDEYRASFACDPSGTLTRLRLKPVRISGAELDPATITALEELRRSRAGGSASESAMKLHGDTYDIGGWAKANPVPGDKPIWTSVGSIPGPYSPTVVISPLMTLDPRVVPEGGLSPQMPLDPAIPGQADDKAIWLVFSAIVGLTAFRIGLTYDDALEKLGPQPKPDPAGPAGKTLPNKWRFPFKVVTWLGSIVVGKAVEHALGPSPSGAPSGAPQGSNGSSGGQGTTETGQSPNAPANDYGAPDRPEKTEGGSGSSDQPASRDPEIIIEYEDDDAGGGWHDLRTGEKGGAHDKTPHPDDPDGGGEGPEGRWWEGLPWLDPFIVVNEFKNPIGTEEGGEAVFVRPEDAGLSSQLTAFLFPRPVGVDEGGEGLIIRIDQVRTSGDSSSGSNTDGWGDTPRSIAEAYAAMRIRVAAIPRT